jgi:hypothetical protein
MSLITKIKLGLSAARVANGPLAQVKGESWAEPKRRRGYGSGAARNGPGEREFSFSFF